MCFLRWMPPSVISSESRSREWARETHVRKVEGVVPRRLGELPDVPLDLRLWEVGSLACGSYSHGGVCRVVREF